MDSLFELLSEFEKLKSVYRKTWLIDRTRRENSAEHSWHLALALLMINEKFDPGIDTLHALKLALVHDIGEIDAGDLSVFDANRQNKYRDEKRCVERIAALGDGLAREIPQLWEEYAAQQTLESRWVKVLDRLLPFMLNLNTEGVAWTEMDVQDHQVRDVIRFVADLSPEIHQWMLAKVEVAVRNGWLGESA